MTKKEYLESTDRCELCGSPKKLEIHHIIPLCAGGEDSLDNWICICKSCHSKLTPSGQLTRIGLNVLKIRNSIISIYDDFYNKINEQVENNDSSICAIDIMDIFDDVYEKYANDIWAMIKNKRAKEDKLFCNTASADNKTAKLKQRGGSKHRVPSKKEDACIAIKKVQQRL